MDERLRHKVLRAVYNSCPLGRKAISYLIVYGESAMSAVMGERCWTTPLSAIKEYNDDTA